HGQPASCRTPGARCVLAGCGARADTQREAIGMRSHIRSYGPVMLAAGVLACNNVTRNAGDAPLPSGLIVLPGATNVVTTPDFSGVVRFQLDEPYPARKAIDVLESHLRQDGWILRPDDFM